MSAKAVVKESSGERQVMRKGYLSIPSRRSTGFTKYQVQRSGMKTVT